MLATVPPSRGSAHPSPPGPLKRPTNKDATITGGGGALCSRRLRRRGVFSLRENTLAAPREGGTVALGVFVRPAPMGYGGCAAAAARNGARPPSCRLFLQRGGIAAGGGGAASPLGGALAGWALSAGPLSRRPGSVPRFPPWPSLAPARPTAGARASGAAPPPPAASPPRFRFDGFARPCWGFSRPAGRDGVPSPGGT